MLHRSVVRLVPIALVALLAAFAPQAAGAQDELPDPPEPPRSLPSPGLQTATWHACLATPFGDECHQVTVSGHGSFSGWELDEYGHYTPTYSWSLTTTYMGSARVPTYAVMFDYRFWDGRNWEPSTWTHWLGDPGHVGPYRAEDHGFAWGPEDGYLPVYFTTMNVLRETGGSTPLQAMRPGPMPQAVVTPEPATVALLAGGLLVIGGVSVRRRRA